jgi:hypothetical protein
MNCMLLINTLQGNWPEAVVDNSFRVLEQEHLEKKVSEDSKEAQPIEEETPAKTPPGTREKPVAKRE